MKLRSLLAVTLPALTLALAPATDAAAKGACVYVTLIRGQKSLQCADNVANEELCKRKSLTGNAEFHPGKVCTDLDHAFHPGPAPIPPPPAKPNVDTKRPRWDDIPDKARNPRDDR